ncbi:MAG: peptidoglycan-N-acetylglucosamine deacetylase [Actinomycetota bacterium]|nr:peptidoglycan-N-acetylglucosamine deacetylase [Actinomycetota bacterium]
MREIVRCFTFHAERLERPDVWGRTRRVLDVLERKHIRATLFVHPFSALRSGADLSPAIAELLQRGHEVAQHTHFYAEPKQPDVKPESDFSAANVRRRLDQDLAELRRCGADPKGFVPGGWAMSPDALAWLGEHRFHYDAGVRNFPLRYASPAAEAGEGWSHPRREANGVLLMPTTAPVTHAALGGMNAARIDELLFDVVYLHDYDLLARKGPVAVRVLLARWGSKGWTTAGDLATRIGDAGG